MSKKVIKRALFGNLKKNLDAIIANFKNKNNEIYSRCIYNNTDKTRQNLLLKLFSTINNTKAYIQIIQKYQSQLFDIEVVVSCCH